MPDKTTGAGSDTPAFEETLASLEALVTRMEEGQMSLDEALAAFETGVRLTRQCQQALQAAELRVQMLSRPDGELEPFAAERPGTTAGEF
ncbi:MAG TPA: exodeoxyribonuclease VII small subunit [Pseudohongiella sp.]|nr:exodeoxyribonuclease VII small subunit [Pseudohongiella sp.]